VEFEDRISSLVRPQLRGVQCRYARLADHIASLLFAPTSVAAGNLEQEGVSGDKVAVVGDFTYDATLCFRSLARLPAAMPLEEGEAFVLCTIHRAENTDPPDRLRKIVARLYDLSEQVNVVLPLHPRTLKASERTANCTFDLRVKVIQPVGFLEMAWLLDYCQLVITDSGGLQKEAYFHGKICMTLREETEWVGVNQLCPPTEGLSAMVLTRYAASIGPDTLFSDSVLYGEGTASEKIVARLRKF
jgi:UDP-GlcNAc3NAcA epimerase